ncbi:hypothetical protein LXL04_012530 [Taraxacum kok-saghyz]
MLVFSPSKRSTTPHSFLCTVGTSLHTSSRVSCTPHVDCFFPYACLVILVVPSTHSNYISRISLVLLHFSRESPKKSAKKLPIVLSSPRFPKARIEQGSIPTLSRTIEKQGSSKGEQKPNRTPYLPKLQNRKRDKNDKKPKPQSYGAWAVTSDRAVCHSTQRTRVQTLPEEITTAFSSTQFSIKGLHCFGRDDYSRMTRINLGKVISHYKHHERKKRILKYILSTKTCNLMIHNTQKPLMAAKHTPLFGIGIRNSYRGSNNVIVASSTSEKPKFLGDPSSVKKAGCLGGGSEPSPPNIMTTEDIFGLSCA